MFKITNESPVFIIAEIGLNHGGSIDKAKQLIAKAKKAGADCVKFQMRSMNSLYTKTKKYQENLGSQYVLDVLEQVHLSDDDLFKAFDFCKEIGIMPLCTPWDLKSFEKLEDYGMEVYKIASADLTNHDLIQAIKNTGKWFFLSTGMSTEDEIMEVIETILKPKFWYRHDNHYVLMHCNSTYPPPIENLNLRYIPMLHSFGKCFVGYSGHEFGTHIPIAAVTLGAKVIEKHITLNKNGVGNDNRISLLPSEFATMVNQIREVEQALGTDGFRTPNQGEIINRSNLAKSLVAKTNLKKGDIITSDVIDVKSPGRGLQPNLKSDLIGKVLNRNVSYGGCFYFSDITGNREDTQKYNFKRKWGIPVRFYDFKKLMANTNPDFLEFHLSYKDLDENLSDHLDQKYNIDFVVHSPDVFSGDHLLSITHPDEYIRKKSIYELKRVIEFTHRMKKYFPNTKRPKIVVSMGGYTPHYLLNDFGREIRWEILKREMGKFILDGVEVLFQTLPPFPWYFGGRYYCNLFVHPIETVKFCEQTGFKLCLDLSHAQLACNYFCWSIEAYIRVLRDHIKHLHISDARGFDGEGLQIGVGDMKFRSIITALNVFLPNISFIPEIWMGHENDGEGFWKALKRLEEVGL